MFRYLGYLYLSITALNWILILIRNFDDIREQAVFAIIDLSEESFGLPGEAMLYRIVMVPMAVIMYLAIAFLRSLFYWPLMWLKALSDTIESKKSGTRAS